MSYFRWPHVRPIHPKEVEQYLLKYERGVQTILGLCDQFSLNRIACDAISQASNTVIGQIENFRKSYDVFMPTSQVLGALETLSSVSGSIFYHAIVAFHFQADKIYLNAYFKDLYPDKYADLSRQKKKHFKGLS